MTIHDAFFCLLVASIPTTAVRAVQDGQVVKSILTSDLAGENRLANDQWRAYEDGFERAESWILCDNAGNAQQRRGAAQTVVLNQQTPAPIVARAWSRAEEVSGAADSGYSLYLDLTYTDGTPLYGQIAAFSPGTHDWQRRQVVVIPDKPVQSVHVYLLLRNHGGKVWFRDPELRTIDPAEGAFLFDGLPVLPDRPTVEGFQIRDVKAESDFVRIQRQALGIRLDVTKRSSPQADFFEVALTNQTGDDRAITLIYSVPREAADLRWFHDPRESEPVVTGREYMNVSHFRVGTNGRLSRYPFAAVGRGDRGDALGIDVRHPAFYRIGYNVAAGELFLAFDVGLSAEVPTAKLRFCRFPFDAQHGFRGALATYYNIFPSAFQCRTPKQGLWMPFAKISEVEGWEDFGFRFKEGNNETSWDDQHDIITFRYTEPMTWWMRMPANMPRTMEAARNEAQRLAARSYPQALAWQTSGYQNDSGEVPARLLDTPWCNGAVWSMNAMPAIRGQITEFKLKWNADIKERCYGDQRQGDLDGEYVDSSEGYVTDELDFNRNHLAAAQTPLCFSMDTRRVAIFRGLIAYEYVRALAEDVHGMNKLMMANSTPIRLCWLAPWLDVLGTETNWHRNGKWQPMHDREMLYRRAICKGKPYCFLQNTEFEQFSHELVEKYMKRSLAYGMFPGFFSHNASQGHYFTRPELYNRDRPLFQKYIPLCKQVAEAGWEPITHARTSDERVYVERFGSRFLTVFNDSDADRHFTVTVDRSMPETTRELVSSKKVQWQNGSTSLFLAAEDVAVIMLE
jgi:hypothetical protein